MVTDRDKHKLFNETAEKMLWGSVSLDLTPLTFPPPLCPSCHVLGSPIKDSQYLHCPKCHNSFRDVERYFFEKYETSLERLLEQFCPIDDEGLVEHG